MNRATYMILVQEFMPDSSKMFLIQMQHVTAIPAHISLPASQGYTVLTKLSLIAPTVEGFSEEVISILSHFFRQMLDFKLLTWFPSSLCIDIILYVQYIQQQYLLFLHL